ncbi:hypothetical protein DNTS_000433 [Danionella cerebrum]|uniref:Ig-like domain-containing protein n=1 Tax=Danionella cerebrum TaxID=2873325 RepID=A0A553R095_9TELE|nr:hypothetical protein DNTS_000433 [Danionella translucida]
MLRFLLFSLLAIPSHIMSVACTEPKTHRWILSCVINDIERYYSNLPLCVCSFISVCLGRDDSALKTLEVLVPEVPVLALFGSDVILNCSFSSTPGFNLSDLSVFWQLSDTRRLVHSFSQSRDQLSDQDERFANRTKLFSDQLVTGNASLQINRVRVGDEGIYSCFVRVQTHGSAALILQVAAPFSRPVLSWDSGSILRPGECVALVCVSSGGFPEAIVEWSDGAGQNLTQNASVSNLADERGLFSLQSELRVCVHENTLDNQKNTYTCRVSNPRLGREEQASVSITGQPAVFPPVALWITVALAVCLLGLLVALAVVCRRKIKESCEEMRAEEEAKELEETKVLEEAKTGCWLKTRY